MVSTFFALGLIPTLYVILEERLRIAWRPTKPVGSPATGSARARLLGRYAARA
jgi:hypothetical protein